MRTLLPRNSVAPPARESDALPPMWFEQMVPPVTLPVKYGPDPFCTVHVPRMRLCNGIVRSHACFLRSHAIVLWTKNFVLHSHVSVSRSLSLSLSECRVRICVHAKLRGCCRTDGSCVYRRSSAREGTTAIVPALVVCTCVIAPYLYGIASTLHRLTHLSVSPNSDVSLPFRCPYCLPTRPIV